MVAKKTAAKKSATAVATGATAVDGKDVAGKQSTAGKAVGKKAAAKKTGTAAPARKAAAVAEEAAEETPAAHAPAKKAPARKTAARKATAAKKQTGARTVAAKKTAGGVTTAEDEAAVPSARTGELAVRPGEDPWTPEEVEEARSSLQAEVLRLRSELVHSREELTGLMRDSGDGAGDDQADTGTKNITREHELALAANAREMLEQTEHALERLDAGTYGLCEVCGKPIGKARMQAFPRATLCVEDKQRQERRG
ncbi:Putative DNA-binding protein [Streptomyces venezuelae]|uniref:TraR/DksA family transcriptional regulator n=1 Tax=Streptomyces gardneri TaxID=66892 RepID=UPI0006BD115D|nr:TraR/DksA C4-type zinc finger protein [Streptomyces gardneri]ALO07702.1 Putative DNA-binding protein [Streptomyces venezuelae]QPK45008.1 TraR/DksA C4-type zinc finger protein [Streptomyces gardneri]WRK36323.1 TraR/DksA C4-type zinc finger protein [Streptomyces venezuelae]CUM41964.1 putative DNA-binding protein [Streptomyces venezuelae]